METDPREHEAQLDDPTGESSGEQPEEGEESNGNAGGATAEDAGEPEAPGP
jgi:hypothetical protein